MTCIYGLTFIAFSIILLMFSNKEISIWLKHSNLISYNMGFFAFRRELAYGGNIFAFIIRGFLRPS